MHFFKLNFIIAPHIINPIRRMQTHEIPDINKYLFKFSSLKLNKSNAATPSPPIKYSTTSLSKILIPNPNNIPKTGAPIDPDIAISAYPVFANEVFTIKSGNEFPQAIIVILKKDCGIFTGNISFIVVIISIRIFVRNHSHKIDITNAAIRKGQCHEGRRVR